MAKDRLHIDYESYCDLSLPDVGAYRYTSDPSFEVLMAAYSFNDGPIQQWVPAEGEVIPKELKQALDDPEVLKWAWNAPFEIAATEAAIGPVQTRQWRCTMTQALHCSLPGKLEMAGPILGLDVDKLKDRRGKALMRKFSFPRKPTKALPVPRLQWYHAPKEWEEYLQYNRTDVEAERAIFRRLRKYMMSDEEWELWFLDQKINRAGLPINMRMVENAIRTYEEALTVGLEEMAAITGLKNPNSGPQLLPWLKEQGYPFDDLKKGHVTRAIARLDEEITSGAVPLHEVEDLWRVLELRQEVSRTSIKKFYAFQRAAGTDGNLRGTLQMNAAARTGRWGGRIVQPQNLARPEKRFEKFIPQLARHVELSDRETLNLIYGNVFDVLASCIRPAIQAPAGQLLVDADLSAIENRVLGWMAECDKILDVFRKGLDPYLSFATYLYGLPYAVLKAEYDAGDGSKRTIAKPGTLGCPRGDTLVLTDRGWVRLDQVTVQDRVHDGAEWVHHDGVVCQGEMGCVNLSGVVITGDHKVWQGGEEWREAQDQDSLSWKQATAAAASLLFDTSKTDPLLARYTSAAAIAGARSSSEEIGFLPRIVLSGGASIAQGEKPAPIGESGLKPDYTTRWPAVFTQSDAAVPIQRTRRFGYMGHAESNVGFALLTSSFGIASRPFTRTARLRSTARITTDTTNPETFGWEIGRCRIATVGTVIGSKSMVAGILQPSFGGSLRPAIATTLQSQEKRVSECQRQRSSRISRDAGVHTVFDVVNAGPRNRFVILSEDGPAVIHNCGYQMGAGDVRENKQTGELEATGLLGYAWNMGVRSFTKEDSQLSVDTFRREFVEVKRLWYAIERAAKRCVRTGQPVEFWKLRFEMRKPFMVMVLPSGRPLYYLRPRLEEVKTPWGDMRQQITYEGQNDRKQWVRINMTPGKLTENADQAISRDLLVHGMKLADKRGLDLRLHVHDQLIALATEQKSDRALRTLIECMEEPPKWASGLPLGSNGFLSPVFMKD